MIKITNLTKIYNTNMGRIAALDNINLHIKKGDIFGIIGLSGAGKTTLLKCMNLLEKPTAGSIVIDDIDITKISARQLKEVRRKIGMIFQHFNLLSHRTVYGNVALPLEITGVEKNKIKEKVRYLLELVDLSDKINCYPSELSGGQKQRVGIARALANDPKVLLCDEPTSALDPKTTLSILELLKDINEKFGITIVIISHDLNAVKKICNNIAVIEDGRILEQGSIFEIFNNSKSDIVRNFIQNADSSEFPGVIKIG